MPKHETSGGGGLIYRLESDGGNLTNGEGKVNQSAASTNSLGNEPAVVLGFAVFQQMATLLRINPPTPIL